jgi:hypothetical protein
MSALPSKDDISMSVLASIVEPIELLKYLTHMLLGYADTDLPKKSRFTANSQILNVTFRITLVKRLLCYGLLLGNKDWVRKSNGDEL